jgi:nitrogen fixation NifU-like protein
MVDGWVYSDIVKEHFLEPKNVLRGDKSDFDHNCQGIVGNVICGDQMLVLLKIENDIIKDIKWRTYGCASAIASTSMMSEIVKGMTIQEAYNITPEIIEEKLGGLPKNKFHCSVLGDKALRKAINNYLVSSKREPYPEKDSSTVCNCKGVDEDDIKLAYINGATTIEKIQEVTGAGTVCGGCRDKIQKIIDTLAAE